MRKVLSKHAQISTMSQCLCGSSIMHIKSLLSVSKWKWTTTWSVGTGQLSALRNSRERPLSTTPAVIKAASLCVSDWEGYSEQLERPDFSNGSLHTLSRKLLKALSSARFSHLDGFSYTDFTDVIARSSAVHTVFCSLPSFEVNWTW